MTAGKKQKGKLVSGNERGVNHLFKSLSVLKWSLCGFPSSYMAVCFVAGCSDINKTEWVNRQALDF